ncbi:uncharacterized protein LOC108912190 [Anoplophora glabripennis]|uniref:uncharacterized protein LOC108912190 n=1 Tax=Anoplophora glabripennis TaxID=217634 RepID=UPI0008745BA0|nr:uncharacterized protein LOC108912190 [Anoplophora glabripennis]
MGASLPSTNSPKCIYTEVSDQKDKFVRYLSTSNYTKCSNTWYSSPSWLLPSPSPPPTQTQLLVQTLKYSPTEPCPTLPTPTTIMEESTFKKFPAKFNVSFNVYHFLIL